MLPEEFIKETERLFTENFEKYLITKSRGYFSITKEDCEFKIIRNENCYNVHLETSDLHYLDYKVSVCGLENLVGTFQDCIFKDHFEDTITCFMNVLIYKQNRLRRQFREIGKKYNIGGNKNVK